MAAVSVGRSTRWAVCLLGAGALLALGARLQSREIDLGSLGDRTLRLWSCEGSEVWLEAKPRRGNGGSGHSDEESALAAQPFALVRVTPTGQVAESRLDAAG
ncbi:MAG TPA: hypothetical protein VD838_09230, partial [Anaeromyxobacteraceae bacterium]|nr:hypothetical protein [Anaeromyxobacteraceae bacterium]